jgi:RND family efflux transporter MFP subunit
MKLKNLYPLLIAGVPLMLASCSSDDKKNANEDTKPVVQIQQVYEKDVPQISTYTATVEPSLINNISAQVSNRIKQIYVDEGMRVSKGQKLVLLDDVNTTAYELQVSNAKASLNNVELEYNRAMELYKIGGGTKQAEDQMELQLVNARNALASAERTLRNARENTVLTSPVNGVVTARNYDPGDMTGSLPILTIGQVQPVKVVVNISETELSKIHKGMPAAITFDTYGDEVFKGTITLISPTVDSSSKTFGVEITLPNSDGRVLPGMFARVSLDFGSENHVVVPDRAVIKQPGSGNHYVYVYADGKVTYNLVELGRRMGDTYEILSGIADGDQVVIAGQSKLASGMAVTIAK